MASPSKLPITLIILVLMPPQNYGQESLDQMVKHLQPFEETEEDGLNVPLGFPGDDYFRGNDSSCVIIDGSTLIVENCHEHVEKPFPIMFREIWESAIEVDKITSPIKLVVIKDGGQDCNSTKECMSQVQSLRKRSQKKGCDLRENFYIGGDGNAYEGRGWNLQSYWHLNGFRRKSITVQFLGTHDRTSPSPEAVEAFETVMEIGLWQGKLSEDYKVTSMNQLLRDNDAPMDLLSQNLADSDRWCEGKELYSLWEYSVPRHLRFVFRRHWNASRPTKEFDAISSPVNYLVISEGGERCFSREECVLKMQDMQAESIVHYGDLLDNFYIGDGGEVYEGRGWLYAPHWHMKNLTNRYLSIHIFGSYESTLPSREVINSLKLLVQTGVWLGKISPEHQMFSLRQVYNQSVLLGESLHSYVSRWSIWSDELLTNNSFSVKRNEWGSISLATVLQETKWPVKYIMIGDGGSRCYSIQQCSVRMQEEQNLYRSQYGDLLDNFYIADDGLIYEGRGWSAVPFLHTPFFNRSLITVKFLGSFQNDLPSQPGWLAFLALLNTGIASGMISPDYKIYSFRHVYNDSSLLGNEISQLFENMTAWDRQLSLATENQLASMGVLPMYSIEYSHFHQGRKPLPPLSFPVDYIVVGDTGKRCFTHNQCMEDLRRKQTVDAPTFGGLTYNFYVGEDGSVIAGRGWDSTSVWHVMGLKANALFVSFSGIFQDSLPSLYAMLAFNRLLKFGVGTGKLATNYKIVSVQQLYPNSTHAGKMLIKSIKSLRRWSEYEAVSPSGTIIPFGPSAFVPKTKWSARGVTQVDAEKLKYPISNVIILEADESCQSMDDCILRVQAEQRRVHPQFGDAMENFYIGEDGHIYEGRGWTQKTQWHSRILSFDFITVAFLGKFQSHLPSSKSFLAFEYLMKEGIMEQKLAANYSVFSLKQFISKDQSPGVALDKFVRTWDNWSNDISKAYITDNFQIVTTSEWGSIKSIRRSNKVIHPLKYVFIRDGDESCSSQTECIDKMKTLEKRSDGLTENFYIGGTGKIFEGIGWHYDTKWGFTGWKNAITVQFLGTFGSSQLPTTEALVAFETFIQKGLKLGYIISDYKILHIPDNYNTKVWVGSKLKQLMMTWKHWSSTI